MFFQISKPPSFGPEICFMGIFPHSSEYVAVPLYEVREYEIGHGQIHPRHSHIKLQPKSF